VGGALAEQEEERRLLEALDAGADGPAVRAAGAATGAAHHQRLCK
jgi:hypothetical protein